MENEIMEIIKLMQYFYFPIFSFNFEKASHIFWIWFYRFNFRNGCFFLA